MTSGQHNDQRLALWAGRATYQSLLEAGITIEEYDRTLLHSKLIIVDEHVIMFGSPNMNQRSQSLDEEIAVICRDVNLAEQLLADIARDREHCRAIDPERWRKRPVRMRAGERLARFFHTHL